MKLHISRETVNSLVKHARKELPNEAVAFLLGRRKEDEVEVLEIRLVRNVLRSSTRFHVSPKELYKVYTDAEEKGLEVIGIFHSHPTSSSPSPTDLRYMKLNPVVWLILSTIDWDMRAFKLDERVKEVEIIQH
jgi:proteasome lid subunit RPN8/RPN11